MGNYAKIDFKIPFNGILDIPGCFSFFTASDVFESQFNKINEDQEISGITNLFFFSEKSCCILKPNILPVDMTGKDIEYYDFLKKQKYIVHQGDNYNCWYGKWEIKKAVGSPPALCEFQSLVYDENNKIVQWQIEDGYKKGKNNNGIAWEENQGFVVWIGKNLLPENEKQIIEFFLKIDNNKGDWKEGIYISIEDGKEFKLAHCKTLKTLSTIPPREELFVQWEEFSLSEGNKKIYDWLEVDVYAVFFIDDYIVVSKNGVSNYKAIKCQRYDIGKDLNDKEYPIIINSGANFYIKGKGQVLLGWKRITYEKEGSLQTKLIFPGYKLNAPKVVIIDKYEFEGTDISGVGYSGGKQKLGGKIQVGPLAGIDWEKGAYAEVFLKAEPIDPSGKNSVLSKVSYRTPVLFSFAIKDERTRKTGIVNPPFDIEGDITNIDLTFSASETDLSFRDASCDIEIECTENKENYIELLQKKILYGEAILNNVSLGHYIFNRLTLYDEEYKKSRFRLEGESIFYRLEETNILVPILVEGLSHTEAMKKLCEYAGVEIETIDDESIILSGEKEKWLFSSGTNFLEAMQKIRKISNWLLYPERNGKVKYIPFSDTSIITFNREQDPVANIEYRTSDITKTRIKIIGKANRDTEDFFEGDTLVGIIHHKSKELEIGYDLVYEETDDSLSDWDLIEKRLYFLDENLNKQNFFISFNITDARNYLNLNLYDVFTWQDPKNSFFNSKKFVITRISFNADAFTIKASITGKMI